MQSTLHLNITLCLLVNNSFKSIKSLFTFVVEHSLLVQPSERPVSFFVLPSVTNQSLLRDFIGSFGTILRSFGSQDLVSHQHEDNYEYNHSNYGNKEILHILILHSFE